MRTFNEIRKDYFQIDKEINDTIISLMEEDKVVFAVKEDVEELSWYLHYTTMMDDEYVFGCYLLSVCKVKDDEGHITLSYELYSPRYDTITQEEWVLDDCRLWVLKELEDIKYRKENKNKRFKSKMMNEFI